VMDRSIAAGVEKVFMPNIDSATIDAMLRVEEAYDSTFPMMGLHPCSVNETYEEELKIVDEWFARRDFVAVGEIGIDLYWDQSFREQQIEAFKYQLQLAKKKKIPSIIHCRESLDLTISVIQDLADAEIFGIFHCFTGDIEQGQKIIEMGFYLGIGGVATFKNGGMDKVLPYLPLDRMVLETDSPYLSPVPYRGKRNEPSYLVQVANRLAELQGVSFEEINEQTTRNAEVVFKQ